MAWNSIGTQAIPKGTTYIFTTLTGTTENIVVQNNDLSVYQCQPWGVALYFGSGVGAGIGKPVVFSQLLFNRGFYGFPRTLPYIPSELGVHVLKNYSRASASVTVYRFS